MANLNGFPNKQIDHFPTSAFPALIFNKVHLKNHPYITIIWYFSV